MRIVAERSKLDVLANYGGLPPVKSAREQRKRKWNTAFSPASDGHSKKFHCPLVVFVLCRDVIAVWCSAKMKKKNMQLKTKTVGMTPKESYNEAREASAVKFLVPVRFPSSVFIVATTITNQHVMPKRPPMGGEGMKRAIHYTWLVSKRTYYHYIAVPLLKRG